VERSRRFDLSLPYHRFGAVGL